MQIYLKSHNICFGTTVLARIVGAVNLQKKTKISILQMIRKEVN